MATTTRSQLQGFKELNKVLKALPGRLAERELTSAVRAGAAPGAPAAWPGRQDSAVRASEDSGREV